MIFDKKKIPFNKRVAESQRVLAKFSDKIPVIIETSDKELIKYLDKNKFLVPYDVPISYLIISIRKQLKLDASKALFLFCDNILVSSTATINTIYDDYKIRNNIIGYEHDHFLYMSITLENTFGN